jgi:hypothetical protein
MSKDEHYYPGKVHFYMVAVEAPKGLIQRPNAQQAAKNARNINEHNAQLVDEFDRMAQRIGYNPEDYHIQAAKNASFVFITGSAALMNKLQDIQGDSIKSFTLTHTSQRPARSSHADGPKAALPTHMN